MTTLAQDSPRVYELGEVNEIGVIAADIIYEGAAVGDNASGYARPLVSGDPFLGFAEAKVDNAAGAAGDKRVRVKRKGLIQLSVANAAITDVGRPVYADDDDTFALVGAGTYIGNIVRFVSSGVVIVAFDAAKVEDEVILPINLALAGITGNGDVVTNYTLGFSGRVKKVEFVVTTVVTTAAKAATLNLEINTTNLTGGVVALTSANCTPLGAKVAGTAVTAANAFDANDTLSVEAASVTAFAEGEGTLLITLGRAA